MKAQTEKRSGGGTSEAREESRNPQVTMAFAGVLCLLAAGATAGPRSAACLRSAVPRRAACIRMAGSAEDILNIGWDNQTSASAASQLDALMSRSADRLNALGGGDLASASATPARGRRQEIARTAADDAVDTSAMLESRRRRLAGELEPEHEAEIRSALKMSALWPSAKRAIDELMSVRQYMSFHTPLAREYFARLAQLYEQAGSTERARAVRQAAGLDSAGGNGLGGGAASDAEGGNPEMAKLLDLSLPTGYDDDY